MAVFKREIPIGFDGPIALPRTPAQGRQWQTANRAWWERHPMRYDWHAEIGGEEFSRDFYFEIDRRFFSTARAYMPWARLPFDQLIPFDALADRDVLEIGIGSGSHAGLLARHARSFTGIDLTAYATRSTARRLRIFGAGGAVLRMDAEELAFADSSFDFIWSWGVIHHSSDTARVLEEMHRVLRPGGRAVVMVYHRNLWSYQINGGLFRGLVLGDLLRTRSLNETVQRWTDGALARYYRPSEWRRLAGTRFVVQSVRVFGNKAELFPLPAGSMKRLAMRMVPDAVTRFLTNRCRLGTFLVSELVKPAAAVAT